MSFRIDYTHFDAELFPTTNPNIYWDFVVAPFWSDADLRLEGRASWEIHDLMQSEELVNAISVFIQQNYDGAENFSGTWMIVAFWEDVHPWPHGVGFNTPFTLSVRDCSQYKGLIYHCVPSSFAGKYLPGNCDHRWNEIVCSVHIQMWGDGVGR